MTSCGGRYPCESQGRKIGERERELSPLRLDCHGQLAGRERENGRGGPRQLEHLSECLEQDLRVVDRRRRVIKAAANRVTQNSSQTSPFPHS